MNERIQELAEKCGFRRNPNIYDRNQSFDIEKFAELIVRECMEVSLQSSHRDDDMGTIIASHIKKHFGVE